MRRAAKVDDNHGDVVEALRRVGAAVLSLAPIGNGAPDLLVYFRGRYSLLEVKDGSKPPSDRRLTPKERQFHQAWPAPVAIVESPVDALRAIGALT